jgi:hypothetical protein
VPRDKFTLVDLGPLPVELIEGTLGIELNPGPVVFTVSNQKHSARRHPDDFERCLPHIASVVARPTYVRDDFKNAGKIELIARVPAMREGLLIAIELRKDEFGRYRVASVFPVSQKKIDARREAGTLLIVKGKRPR